MTPDLNRYEDPWTAEVYDYKSGMKDDDLAFWTALAADAGGPVLELACGTGRVAIPLARAGHRVTALEISPHMLAVARRKLEREAPEVQARLRLVEGNMAGFSLDQEFALIFIAFRSFQALTSRAEQRRCLESCARHLLDGGFLAINVFNPRLPNLVKGNTSQEPQEYTGPANARIRESWQTNFDTANQCLVGRARYECTGPDGHVTVREHLLRLRYLFRFEMQWMLEACGFEVEALYGDFGRGEFTAESSEMVFVARRG